MKREEVNNLTRNFVWITPIIVLKCKADDNINFTKGKEYIAIADTCVTMSNYTDYAVLTDNNIKIILQVQHIKDIFEILESR